MHYTKLQFEIRSRVGYISMNAPDTLNAVDLAMARDLLQAFREAEQNPSVNIVVLRGRGPAFSAGGDISYFQKLMNSGEYQDLSKEIEAVRELTLYMTKMNKIILASVHGAAAGAGASLAFSSDLILCGSRARFLMAFVGLGLVPDTGGAYLLSRSLGRQRAMALCLTGDPLSAEEAEKAGLVYKTFPDNALEAETEKLAERLADGPLVAYRNMKQQIRDACLRDYNDFLQNSEAPTQMECSRTDDFREGVNAFMERRKAKFFGQ
ncbi:MAG: enoyl-CoA hydratase/isomerase family protein [Firmicutes bacterium]|nr:enoyl-CoA hydratase/isomerase family protein [Bacillota bacterium]